MLIDGEHVSRSGEHDHPAPGNDPLARGSVPDEGRLPLLTRPRGFHLSKWYLDCVAPAGDTVIAYVAQLGWSGLAIGYASVLERREGKTRVTTSLRGYEAPVSNGDTLTWSSTSLGVHGAWSTLTPPVERTLLESDDGLVQWYQWLSVAVVATGALCTALGRSDAATAVDLDLASLLPALAFGLVTWLGMGVDFPESNRRFSRLA
jgi:hypothetical protein